MLTPRHQALLATLAGMTVGVAVFGTVLAINDQTADSSATVVTTPSISTTPGPTDGLQAASLQFALQNFGTEQAPVSTEVPVGWKSSATGTRPRYLDPTGVWQLRFDARGTKQSPDEMVESRANSIDEQNLKVLSRTDGTLIYTYVDKARGPRLGMSRWLAADDGRRSLIEITVGGRPQDQAGLQAVLDHATQTLVLPEDADDSRPG